MDFNYLVNSSAFFKTTQWCGTYMINFILWNYHICPGTLHPILGSVLLWVLELVLFPGSLPEGWWWQCQQDGLWACQGCPTLLQLLPLKLPCQPGGTGCPSPKHCAPWVFLLFIENENSLLKIDESFDQWECRNVGAWPMRGFDKREDGHTDWLSDQGWWFWELLYAPKNNGND